MNESQRLTYLDYLGIDSYVSRRPLKGAAPSSTPRVSVVNRPDAAAKSAMAIEHQEKEQRQGIASHFAILSPAAAEAKLDIGTATTNVNASDIQESDRPKKPLAETIRFSLNCWRVNDELLVLDSHEPGAALPTDTLLLNIVRSIGLPLTQLPQSESLRWPLFEHDQHASDEHQARAMVQAYIQAQVSKKPAKYVLLMGSDAARFAFDEFDDWQSVEGKTVQQWGVTLIVTPGLVNMLREPLLKRITWQAIKPLCQHAYVIKLK